MFFFCLFLTLFLLLLFLLGFTLYAYRVAFYSPMRGRKKDPHAAFDHASQRPYALRHDELVTAIEHAPFRRLTVRSRDGLLLVGRYYETVPNAPIEISFHGYRSNALHDDCVAYETACRRGTNLLLPDQRAHGDSEGHTVAFGVLERYDALTWAEEAVRLFGADTELLLTGVSMGAATVLMAADLPLPPNVKGILADCPYSSPRDILEKVARDRGFPPRLVYPFLRLGARLFGGFDPDAASAVRAVRGARVPILIAHGTKDGFVPYEMSQRIAAASEEVHLALYPDADHGLSYFSDEERYRAMCDAFRDGVLTYSAKSR